MYTKATIFSDGSSRGNPGPGGWGAIVALFGEAQTNPLRIIELGGREENTTNNRMELTGALEAVRLVESLGVRKTVVHTDSSYLVNSLTKWVHGWVKNDWQTKDNKHVLNRDILECFYDLFSLIEMDFKQIPGHSGIAPNERCDEIATSFADKKDVPLFDGPFDTYTVSLALHTSGVGHTNTKEKPSKTAKAHSYVSEINGVIQVHKTWSECKARVEGKKARFKKSVSKEDEERIINSFKR